MSDHQPSDGTDEWWNQFGPAWRRPEPPQFACPNCAAPRYWDSHKWCNRCIEECFHPEQTLVQRLKANGTAQFHAYCDRCGVNLRAVKYHEVETWPGDVKWDESGVRVNRTPCAHCSETGGVEYHHFAPSAIFGPDANDWPGAYLCPRCHRLWHLAMRAAKGYRLTDDQFPAVFGYTREERYAEKHEQRRAEWEIRYGSGGAA